jgi:PAS domain S-box-containing protein
MEDQDKTKEQLLYETRELRRRVQELETAISKYRDDDEEPRRIKRRTAIGLGDDSSEFDSHLSTQSIDLSAIFGEDVTSSGSFSFTGIARTWFGKLLHALPTPAFLVDPLGEILFANEACGRISDLYQNIKGKPFADLFINPWVSQTATGLLQKVFDMRLRETVQGIVEIEGGRMWGRLYMRSIRLGDVRSVLVLIEDLTLEKEQLVLKQKYEEEILKERDELEKRVQERTAELLEANQQLKKEIAERERAEQALFERETRFRMLVENAPVGIICCNIKGEYTDFNPAVLSILGAGTERTSEAIDLLKSSFFEEPRVSNAIRRCMKSGKPEVIEFPHQSHWGKQVFVKLHAVPVRDPEGQITGAQAVIEDVSDRKRNEGLLLRAERLRASVEMAGGVAHNFSTSLQVIAADAQMALSCLETGDLSEVRTLIGQIRDSAHQTAHTVRRLKQFARSRSRLGLQRKFLDVSESVKEAIEQATAWWKMNLERTGAEISLTSNLSADCTAEGDDQELVEVVVNLLKNAAESLPLGGRVSVQTSLENGQVVLEVKDQGVGIPKKYLEKICEPFWTNKPSHVGMGLAVCSGIIRRHNGTLTITSKERTGTAVVVKLPHVSASSREEPTLGKETDLKFRVLLIDADQPALTTLESGFTNLDQTAFVAFSGRQALNIFRAQQIDVVVCDFSIPDMNGWQVAEAIRRDCEEKSIPKPPFIMLVESLNSFSEEEMAKHPSVDRILEKPVKIRGLMEIVVDEFKKVASQATFSGNIHGIDILEYLQLVLLSGQKLIIEIVSREQTRGLLFLDKGVVIHATCGSLEGEEALYKCLSFNGGIFSTLPWKEPEKKSISKPGDLVLFEAARRRDEITQTQTAGRN